MSKSKGNIVEPKNIIEKYGSDTVRWYFYTINQPWMFKLFKEKDLENCLRKFILTFLNCYLFFDTYNSFVLKKSLFIKKKNILDIWILSKLQSLIINVTNFLEKYEITKAANLIENFIINDLSLWYIRRSRKRFQRPEKKEELIEASLVLKEVLLSITKLLAPFLPFLAEYIYQKINGINFRFSKSVHLEKWPVANRKLINKELEGKMERVRRIVSLVLAERKKAKIKVRQPLLNLQISEKDRDIEKDLLGLIKEEVNIKNITFGDKLKLDTKLTKTLREEGIIREIIRVIQELRKAAFLVPKDEILVCLSLSKYLREVLEKHIDTLLKDGKVKKVIFGGEKLEFRKQITLENEKIDISIKKL